MGVFRRKSKDPFRGDEPTAKRRSHDHERAWFEDLPESDVEIDVNRNASFTEADREWLERDPGEDIRRRKR
ncbi:MAG TPA: hypothetical protein VHA73_00995 [Acidimicrobiales bacterium]|jgi:hypothetical protein|nr:hypothetical protein [Acidimicrobiales bacterium]